MNTKQENSLVFVGPPQLKCLSIKHHELYGKGLLESMTRVTMIVNSKLFCFDWAVRIIAGSSLLEKYSLNNGWWGTSDPE